MINFYRIIIYSFKSAQFYKDVFFNLKKAQLKYLLLIVFITSLPGVVLYYFLFSKTLLSSDLTRLIDEFPDIKIQNYKMVDKFSEPYVINLNNGNTAAFVSDKSLVNKFSKENYQVVFFPDGFKVMLGNSYQASDYAKIFPEGDGVINKELLYSGYDFLLKYKAILIFGPLLILIFGQRLVSVLIEIALFATITYFFNRVFFPDKRYMDFFRLMIFAFFPYLIVQSLDIFVPNALLTMFAMFGTLLKVGYAYFATKAIRSS